MRHLRHQLSRSKGPAVVTPETAAFHAAVYDGWKNSVKELSEKRIFQRYAQSRTVIQAWRILGIDTPQRTAIHNGPAFGPLERCHWPDCACSAVKPAHRLKVCKWCWLVAYCSPRCQMGCVNTWLLVHSELPNTPPVIGRVTDGCAPGAAYDCDLGRQFLHVPAKPAFRFGAERSQCE